MSRRENNWYLLRAVGESFGNAARQGFRVKGGLLLGVILVVAAISQVLMAPSERLSAIASSMIPKIPMIFGGVLIALMVWRMLSLRAAYRKGLQHPGPSRLIEVVERMARQGSAVPGIDVVRAQSNAIALSLYGDEEGAVAALSEIDWSVQAPLMQAGGLVAEAFVEFLCRGDASRGLELSRRARELARVSPIVPGGRASAKVYDTLVEIGEVLAGEGSLESLEKLDKGVAKITFPMQLLARFALAVGFKREGKTERAEQHRSFIIKAAPHCGPLLRPAGLSRRTGLRNG